MIGNSKFGIEFEVKGEVSLSFDELCVYDNHLELHDPVSSEEQSPAHTGRSSSLSLWRAVITVLLSDIEIIQISKNTDKISNNLNICCYGKPQKYHYRWWSILLLLVYNGYYSTTIYYKKYRYIDIRDL